MPTSGSRAKKEKMPFRVHEGSKASDKKGSAPKSGPANTKSVGKATSKAGDQTQTERKGKDIGSKDKVKVAKKTRQTYEGEVGGM